MSYIICCMQYNHNKLSAPLSQLTYRGKKLMEHEKRTKRGKITDGETTRECMGPNASKPALKGYITVQR